MTHILSRRLFWLGAGTLILLGVLLLRWQEGLRNRLEDSKKEYQINLDLARHKAEHLAAYERVLGRGKLPQAKPFPPNEWIQSTQTMVGEEKLSLEELKPIRDSKKIGLRNAGLFLVVEGRMSDLFNFFYRIATADDPVYVKEFSISQAEEGSDSVRAQITLAQFSRP